MKYAILFMCCMGVIRGSGGDPADQEVVIYVDPPYVTVPSRFGVFGNILTMNRYHSESEAKYGKLYLTDYPNQTLKVQSGESFIKIKTTPTQTYPELDSAIKDIKNTPYVEWDLIDIDVKNAESLGNAIKTFCFAFGLDRSEMVQKIIDLQSTPKLDFTFITAVIKQMTQTIEIDKTTPKAVQNFISTYKFDPLLVIFSNTCLFIGNNGSVCRVISSNTTEQQKIGQLEDVKNTIYSFYPYPRVKNALLKIT